MLFRSGCVPNRTVASTAAEISIEVLFEVADGGIIRKKPIKSHNNSWRAEATLTSVQVNHGLLNGVDIVALDTPNTLDSCNVTPVHSQDRHEASVDRSVSIRAL